MAIPTDQQLRDYGFELAKDHGIDSGNSDNGEGLQTWIDASKANSKPGYIHWSPDPYLTSQGLGCIHRHSFQGSNVPFENIQLVGGKDPTTNSLRPVIKLTAGASGYGDPGNPKPIMYWDSVEPIDAPASLFELQTNPYDMPAEWKTHTGNMYGAYLQNMEFDTSGHAGAIALSFFAAQRCYMADVKVIATGSLGGIWGFPGTNCPSMNIEVVGSQVAIDFAVPPKNVTGGAGELICGLKIDGATTPFRNNGVSSPAVITGFEILNCPGTVYEPQSNSTTHQILVLVDGRIEIIGGGNPIAFDNPNSKNVYLRDVYVTGTDNLAKSGAAATVTGIGTWKRIKEYVCTDPTEDGGEAQSKTRSLIDGVVSDVLEPSTIIENDVADPTSTIRTRHTVTLPTVDDGLDFVDAVADNGADNTGASDSRVNCEQATADAEAAGHDRVFLRRGSYNFSKSPNGDYGLLLRSNTVLFGMPPGGITFSASSGNGTWIRPDGSWLPTSKSFLVQTPDDANGNVFISCMGMNLPRQGVSGSGWPPPPGDPPVNEWFGGIRLRCPGVVWAVPFTDEGGDDSATNPRVAFQADGHAAGQIYHLELNNLRWKNKDARGALVQGPNTGPLLFYGQNFEVTKEGSGLDAYEMLVGCEVQNASNVVVYGKKQEGRSGAILVINSTNIAFFGGGVLDSFIRHKFWFTGASDNLLVGVGVHRSNTQTEQDDMVREELDGLSVFTIIGDEQVSVYKRGEVDLNAMFPTDPGGQPRAVLVGRYFDVSRGKWSAPDTVTIP